MFSFLSLNPKVSIGAQGHFLASLLLLAAHMPVTSQMVMDEILLDEL